MADSTVTGWDVPRVIDGMPHDVYLKDPVPGGSLSSSGARLLIPPSCPAKYRWAVGHPTMPKLDYDIGTAAHRELLGVGPDLEVIDAPDYKRRVNQVAKKTAYAAGKIPILPHQMDMVFDMVQVARAHPLAGRLLDPGTGVPEQSLFWLERVIPDRGKPFEVQCRARLDWLSTLTTKDGRMIVVDYKTAKSVNPANLVRAIGDNGYHMQAAWYLDAVVGCGLAKDAVFLFVFQEKEPPFLITVMELHDVTGLWVGRELNDHARRVYHRCRELGAWPGYSGARKLFLNGPAITYDDDVMTADLPPWEVRKMEDIIGEG